MRQTLRAPGWVLAAASILGLGIGASVALYSVVESVLLRAPMFTSPADLAVIWESDPKRAQAEVEISWERFLAMRKSAGTLAGLASVSSVNLDFALLDGGDPVQVEGVSVTANYFDILDVRPVLGRTLVPVEQRAQHRSDFVVRTSVGPETLVEPVRRAVLALNAEQPIGNVTTLAKLVDGALARPRFLALLFGFFWRGGVSADGGRPVCGAAVRVRDNRTGYGHSDGRGSDAGRFAVRGSAVWAGPGTGPGTGPERWVC